MWSGRWNRSLTIRTGKSFRLRARFLKPGGIIALTDWFKNPNLSHAELQKYIHPIEQGMFVRLEEIGHYEEFLRLPLPLPLRQTSTPIVMLAVNDPVDSGLLRVLSVRARM